MLAAILAATPRIAARVPGLAELRVDGKTPYGGLRYRLWVAGRRTDGLLSGQTAQDPPKLIAYRTRGGTIYGTASQFSDGAIMTTWFVSFARYAGKTTTWHGPSLAGAYGDRILFNPETPFPWAPREDAFVYERGKVRSIAPAAVARFQKDGSIRGWYYADPQDRKYSGELVAPDDGAIFLRAFTWKDGVRPGPRVPYDGHSGLLP